MCKGKAGPVGCDALTILTQATLSFITHHPGTVCGGNRTGKVIGCVGEAQGPASVPVEFGAGG